MAKQKTDRFLATVGKHLGVPPDEIHLRQSKTPGHFALLGPRPKSRPELPRVRNYCFTFVLKTPPPHNLCNAYRQEYDELVIQLEALIEAAAWEEVEAVAQRLAELQAALDGICQSRERAITYCVFPNDWFEDPFVGDRTLPLKPPIPPLRF